MDPVLIFVSILAVFALFMVMGVPIFAALGVSSMVGMWLHSGVAGFDAIPSVLHRGLASYSLICVPLFILMGEVMARTSIGGRLFHMFFIWMNRMPGNLAVASVGSSAVFGAMSGVSVAGAATIGRFAIPEMLKRNYDPRLAGGSVAAAGSLALLIPPSIGFVLYGEMADQSIGRLFTAAILPGIMLTLLMMLYLYIVIKLRPGLAPRADQTFTWAERVRALLGVWAPLLIIMAVLGTIYFGVATPTEASGVGALSAIIVAMCYRELTWRMAVEIVRSTIVTTAMILLIMVSALLFGYITTRLMIPQKLMLWVSNLEHSKWIIFLLVLLFLLVIGMFLDIVSIILITTPIVLPIVTALGFDPIWFGVVLIITCEMAVITPPVGLNLYVIKGIAPDLPLGAIIRGALPFVAVEAFAILMLILFPAIALWLPSLM